MRPQAVALSIALIRERQQMQKRAEMDNDTESGVRYIFSNFAGKTTLHGIGRLHKTRFKSVILLYFSHRNPRWRSLWAMVFLLCTACVLWQLTFVVKKYLSYGTNVLQKVRHFVYRQNASILHTKRSASSSCNSQPLLSALSTRSLKTKR